MPREDFALLRTPTRTADHEQLVRSSRDAAAIMNDMRDGKLNCVGEVTLTASATTTTVTDFRVRAASFISLMPTTLNAALALAPAPALTGGSLPYTFGSVTLDDAAEAEGTTVTDANVLSTSKIVLIPTSIDAAGEIAGLFSLDEARCIVYDIIDGGFTIAQTAIGSLVRTFDYINFLADAPAPSLSIDNPAYVSDVTKHQFTITHANNAQTDRTFRYSVLG